MPTASAFVFSSPLTVRPMSPPDMTVALSIVAPMELPTLLTAIAAPIAMLLLEPWPVATATASPPALAVMLELSVAVSATAAPGAVVT